MDARSAVERLNFKACVVGKAVVTVVLLHEARLLEGVTFDGGRCLRQRLHLTEVGQADEPDGVVWQHVAHLTQFVQVVCRKNKGSHDVYVCIII